MNPRTRVTARLYRDDDGQIHREYIVDGVAFGSVAELLAVLGGR